MTEKISAVGNDRVATNFLLKLVKFGCILFESRVTPKMRDTISI